MLFFFIRHRFTANTAEVINIVNIMASQQHDKYKAMAVLIMSIKDNIIHHIANFDDPTQAWQALHNLFDNKNATLTMLLINQFHLTTMDEGSFILDYLQKINKIIT